MKMNPEITPALIQKFLYKDDYINYDIKQIYGFKKRNKLKALKQFRLDTFVQLQQFAQQNAWNDGLDDDEMCVPNAIVTEDRVQIVMTTKNMIHIMYNNDGVFCNDTTHKFIMNGYPLHVYIFVDKQHKFLSVCFQLSSKMDESSYGFALDALTD